MKFIWNLYSEDVDAESLVELILKNLFISRKVSNSLVDLSKYCFPDCSLIMNQSVIHRPEDSPDN